MDPADETDLPAASNPTPAASPKPSAAPPVLPRAIDLEEDEAPQGDIVDAIEIPEEPEYNILVVSEGIRFRDNRAFPFQGHQVWCDLRDVANPERDRRLQAHLGYHPLNIQSLMVNETFMRKLFDAMREALVNRVSKIRFVCHSGRHRSVAAAYLAHLVLAGIVGNDRIAVRHASSGHWHNICHLQCNQCWNFVHNPPVEFHRALAEIRHDLQQQCQPYMLDACEACRSMCFKPRWGVGCQHTCISKPSSVKISGVTGGSSSGVDDPASKAPCARAGNDRHHQYDFLFVKNQQNEQFYQSIATQAIYAKTNLDMSHFQQLPRRVPNLNHCSQESGIGPPAIVDTQVLGIHYPEDRVVGLGSLLAFVMAIILDINVMIHPHSPTLCPPQCFNPKHFPPGKEEPRHRVDNFPGVVQQHSCAEAGSQISNTLLIIEQVQIQGGHSDSDVSHFRDQSPFSDVPPNDGSPDPTQCFDEDSILHDDRIQSYDDDDLCENYQPSCPPTVLDGSESQTSQGYRCSYTGEPANLPSFNRKRSAQQAFEDELSQELHIALQYEYAPSSHHYSEKEVNTNEVASLQQCIYDGYYFADEYQQMQCALQEPEQQSSSLTVPGNDTFLNYLNEANLEFHNFGCPDSSDVLDIWEVDSEGGFILAVQPNQVLLHEPNDNFGSAPVILNERVWEEWTINTNGEFVFCACSQHTDDTAPFHIQLPSQNHTQPEENDWADRHFWDEWEQDSDGHLHQRTLPSHRDADLFSQQHSEQQSVWGLDPYEFLSSEHYTSAIMSEPSSHPSLRDLQLLQWAVPESIHIPNNPLRGGGKESGKEEFQPTSKDVGRMVQKLKHVPHGLQNKQIRMLLTSNLTLMKKIERTADAQHLLSCITAAAQRVGMQMAQPTVDPTGKGKSSNGKGKVLSNEPSSSSDRQNVTVNLPMQNAKDKGKGKGLPSNAKDRGKGQGQDKGRGKQHSLATIDHDKSKGKGKTKYKLESPLRERPKTSMTLVPEGWGVYPQQEFQPNYGAVYVLDKPELIKQYAEKASGKSFPIGILAPKPYPIGVSEPQMLYIKVEKQVGEQRQIVSIQAFLHHLTYTPVEYKACAPCVEIQKSESGKMQVLYVTFTDEEASTQTKLDLRQHKTYAAKQWLSGIILKRNPRADLEILDMWHLQSVDSKDADTTYQASIRVSNSMSGECWPYRLQVRCRSTALEQ